MEGQSRAFGSPEGIEQRLCYWANQFSRDKQYPWVGTGVIDDLKCAAKLLGADFDVLYPLFPDLKAPSPPPPAPPVVEDWELAAMASRPVVEYDL